MSESFKKTNEVLCLICNESFVNPKKLTNHITKAHHLSSEEYAIEHLFKGNRPMCLFCGEPTRYTSLKFKKYCTEHAKIAMQESGRVGGTVKKTWSKGHTKHTHPILAKFSEMYVGEGNPFFGKTHAPDVQTTINDKNRLSYEEVVHRISEYVPGVILLSKEDDYKTRQNDLLEVFCEKCKTKHSVSLFNIERHWRCRVCYPIGSRPQLEIHRWVKDDLGFVDVTSSDRSVITPLELDIWVKSKNVAIEYNGLYWHSGDKDDVFNKQRHAEKHRMCKEAGIRLLQFYSDEWNQSPEICRSMIKNALGLTDLKLNARDCELVELETKDAREFLDANHISGYTKSSHKWGLKHPIHGLVSVATLRIPIQKKWGNVIELARMASKLGIVVRGGASKLLNRLFSVGKEKGFEGLLSYAELRYGEGRVYECCGLERVGVTGPNYWYTDGVVRYDRFKFRSQNGMSENEFAKSHNVRAVWGVGNNVYLKKF